MSSPDDVRPGAIPHEGIAGAPRVPRETFRSWCRGNDLSITAAKKVTFGMPAGPRPREVPGRMIGDAGREVVLAAWRIGMEAGAARLRVAAGARRRGSGRNGTSWKPAFARQKPRRSHP